MVDICRPAACAVRLVAAESPRGRGWHDDGVPWFMRIECRNRVPVVALHSLVDGEYRPVAAAAAGTRFVMREPFAFEIDPVDLLDE